MRCPSRVAEYYAAAATWSPDKKAQCICCSALKRARNGNKKGFAHDILAGDQLFRLAALLVEYHRGELLQRRARFVERAAMRVHSRQLLDEADVARVRLQEDRGERKPCLFHSRLLREPANRLPRQPFRSVTAFSFFQQVFLLFFLCPFVRIGRRGLA